MNRTEQNRTYILLISGQHTLTFENEYTIQKYNSEAWFEELTVCSLRVNMSRFVGGGGVKT